MATHSSIRAWKIPWTKEPGRLQSMGLQRVGHDWTTSLSLFTFPCTYVLCNGTFQLPTTKADHILCPVTSVSLMWIVLATDVSKGLRSSRVTELALLFHCHERNTSGVACWFKEAEEHVELGWSVSVSMPRSVVSNLITKHMHEASWGSWKLFS